MLRTKAISVEWAVEQLKAVGYMVEVANGIVYARTRVHSMPDRVYITDGMVSRKSIVTLVNKRS